MGGPRAGPPAARPPRLPAEVTRSTRERLLPTNRIRVFFFAGDFLRHGLVSLTFLKSPACSLTFMHLFPTLSNILGQISTPSGSGEWKPCWQKPCWQIYAPGLHGYVGQT